MLAVCFFNDTATTEIYTLSLHDALPISAWAFACLDSKDYQFFAQLMGAPAKHLNNQSLSQFYVVSLHCRLEWPTLSFPVVDSPQALQDAYRRCEARPSGLQCEVAAALDRIGWAHVRPCDIAGGRETV